MKSTKRIRLAAVLAFAITVLVPVGSVAAAPKVLKKAPAASPTTSEPTKMAPATVAVPLTSAECRGLGGTVHTTIKCGQRNQKACSTVDYDGVIRTACIDEVKK